MQRDSKSTACRYVDRRTNIQKKNQEIGVGVVQGYNLRRNNQQQRKQSMRNQNRKNKSKSTGPNNAIKKRTVNGTKYCNKSKGWAMLLTKYTKSQRLQN